MGKGSGNGTTRGDRKRNARRERLRGLLPRDGAVIGIDLAEDKQAIAVIDHDVRVLARKTVRVKAFRLGEALDWAVGQARSKGFWLVTVACEPTGPRWMQVQRLCAERGLPLVCIQPLVSHIAREQQDYTTHKTDLLTELPDVAAGQKVGNPCSGSPGCPEDPDRQVWRHARAGPVWEMIVWERSVTYVGTTSDTGMTMPMMLIILIPLVILAAVVLVYDLKRRRRPAAAVDVASRVRVVRDSTEAKHGITPSGGGGASA